MAISQIQLVSNNAIYVHLVTTVLMGNQTKLLVLVELTALQALLSALVVLQVTNVHLLLRQS